MKLDVLRSAIREHAQRRQSAWMADFDNAIASVTADQKARGKLHTPATAESYAKAANHLLAEVASELADFIIDRLGPDGKTQLPEQQVISEFGATMKFGRDRLASKLLKSIESLDLRGAGEGSDGLARFKRVQSYEPGEGKLKIYYHGPGLKNTGKPLSDWKQTPVERESVAATPTRIWLVVLMLSIGIVAGSAIWLFAELY